MTGKPSQALRALAMGGSREERGAAATITLAGPNVQKLTVQNPAPLIRLAMVLEDAWREIPAPHADLIAGLVQTVRTDTTPLAMQVAAAALALEGEDGVTEVLALSWHEAYAVRSSVAIALSLLGRSARWAVPTLIRFMAREPLEYVRRHVTATLGQIGGREAITKLEELLWNAQGGGSWDEAAEVRVALDHARELDNQGGVPDTAQEHEQHGEDGEEDEQSEDDEDEDPWTKVSPVEVAAEIDSALVEDSTVASPGRVFRPLRPVSLRSALLTVLPGDVATQVRAGAWLDETGIEDAFSRFAKTPRASVVSCSVSSSMTSGSWGVREFRLGMRGFLYYLPDEGEHESILGAWEPATDLAARRACILSMYAREWRERALPPAMGEWATGNRALLQEAILRVLKAEPTAWEDVLKRLEDAPEAHEPSADAVKTVIRWTGAPAEHVRDILDAAMDRNDELTRGLARGLASDEVRRVVIALYVHCISKDPLGFG